MGYEDGFGKDSRTKDNGVALEHRARATMQGIVESGAAYRLYSDLIERLSSWKSSESGGRPMIAPGGAHDPDPSLADARTGSPEALGAVLEAQRRYLLLVAEKELAPDLRAKGGASDLVQETFIEAQRDFEQFRGESGNEFRGWLRRILLHNLGAFTRRYRESGMRDVGREVRLLASGSAGGAVDGLAASASTPSAVVMAYEQSLALQGALDRLPDDYRRVIRLRYDGNLTFEQIGQEMGRSPEAARKLWARAMDCLREEWRSAP